MAKITIELDTTDDQRLAATVKVVSGVRLTTPIFKFLDGLIELLEREDITVSRKSQKGR